jgi:hypothetical protein
VNSDLPALPLDQTLTEFTRKASKRHQFDYGDIKLISTAACPRKSAAGILWFFSCHPMAFATAIPTIRANGQQN